MFRRFSLLLLSVLCCGVALLLSCTETPTRVFVEAECPETEPQVTHAAANTVVGFFRPDFSIVSGIHLTGESILESLYSKNILPSKWTIESLINEADLVLSGEWKRHHIVVISMLDMGFLENEQVPLEAILERARELGLAVLSFEEAVSVREQFLAQPDYATGHRLGEFFIGMSPIRLAADGKPRIASIIRDDNFPHAETGIGLWVVLNDVIADDGQPRRFHPLDPEGMDLGGQFAFGVPDALNLDLIAEMERVAREKADE